MIDGSLEKSIDLRLKILVDCDDGMVSWDGFPFFTQYPLMIGMPAKNAAGKMSSGTKTEKTKRIAAVTK